MSLARTRITRPGFTMFRTLIATALLINIVAAQRASAQGTSGTLPDPMTTAELKGYADRLKLSAQQLQAAQMMHDQYQQEFRALRKGEIADFLKEMRSLQGFSMPKRDVIESFLKKADQLNGKIAAIDNRLFDQMQSILTDDQLSRMPRVRMARQRTRYAANQMMWVTGNRAVDLSEVVMKLDIAPEQFAAIDPTMAQYEGKLTSTISKLYDKSTNMILNVFDAMAQMGFNEESMQNPETAQKMMEAMQQIWRDMTAQVSEINGDLAALNQRTYKTIAPILAPDLSRKLRDEYYTRAYPEAGFGFGSEEPFFTAALKLELTDEQRQGVTATRDELQRKLDRIVEDTASLIDKSRSEFTPFDYGSEKMKDYQQKLKEFQTAMGEARTTAMQNVKAAIGPDLAKQLGDKYNGNPPEMVGMSAMVKEAVAKAQEAQKSGAAKDNDEAPTDEDAPSWNGDQKVPAAISKRDLKDYIAVLNLNEGQQAILRQLHETYMEQYKKVQNDEIAALIKATQNMWRYDEATQTSSGPTSDQVGQVQKLRRAAIEAVHRVDNAFFDDIAISAINDDQNASLSRVRSMRERAGYVQDPNAMGWWMGGATESALDLSRFVRRQKLSAEDLARIDSELIAYEKAATDAFRARFEASLAMQNAQEQWQAEASRAQAESEGGAIKSAFRYQEIMGDVTKRVNEANAAVSKLNRETIAKLLPLLPDDSAVALRNAYNRRAYPNIYNDALALDQRLSSALKLEEITGEQRQRLNEIATDYRPAYARFCDQMVEVGSISAYPTPGFDRDEWKKWQEKQDQLETLKFDRNELNMRTIGKLRALLSDEQIRRIGGLPEAKPETVMED